MTSILALDSSSDACSVALIHGGLTTHIFELAAKSHTQRLLPMVDEILQAAQITLEDLDAIAFGRGPGSFTGIRICMGVVQGLAFGANLPVIPVSTLQAMARDYMSNHPENKLPMLVALDARMDEVYWGLYSPEVIPNPLADEQVMKPAEVAVHSRVTELQSQFVAIGAGWHYPELKTIVPNVIVQEIYPNAQAIVALAAHAFIQNQQVSIMDAQPVYLRDSVSWQKRQRIRTQSI